MDVGKMDETKENEIKPDTADCQVQETAAVSYTHLYLAMVEPRVKAAMGKNFSVYRSEPFFLEVLPRGIDKAQSLERLLSHIGLSREQMIACGDGYNDLTMIQYAGLGVAMENAVLPVRKAADFITYSNNDDGVAHVVEKFML